MCSRLELIQVLMQLILDTIILETQIIFVCGFDRQTDRQTDRQMMQIALCIAFDHRDMYE